MPTAANPTIHRTTCPTPGEAAVAPRADRSMSCLFAWHAAMRAAIRPPDLADMPAIDWSRRHVAFLSAPGETGRRRRQAARLQPMFLGTIASDPAVSALVDAGAPFENALVERGRASVEGDSGLTPAKLRRMRSIGATRSTLSTPAMRDTVHSVEVLPIHAIPDTTEAWDRFLAFGNRLVAVALTLGLDVGTLARGIGTDWDVSGQLGIPVTPRAAPATASSMLDDFLDMARRATETLVGALQADEEAEANDIAGLALAGRLLLGGMPFAKANALCLRWHRGLSAMDRLLDLRPGLAWPALFEPFEAPDGTRVSCVTTSEGLMAEGMEGPDADGVEGLAHCVGGYGTQCAAGHTHIASVHRMGPGGRRTRLSTLQIDLAYGCAVIRQHSARSNGRPPRASREAADALMTALNDGSVAMSPEAMAERRIDRRSGVPLPEASFEAWRPYLPRRLSEGGIAAVRTRIAVLREVPR
jgi:hypothetical protein